MFRSRRRPVHCLPAAAASLAAAVLTAGIPPAEAAETPTDSAVPVEALKPEAIRVSVEDLPAPFASDSVRNSPQVIVPPENFTLNVPEGFAANLFAEGVEKARWLALTPDGDVLVSCGRTNKVYLLQDTDGDGVSDRRNLFLGEKNGANLPFGMDFAETDGRWYFYLGNTNAVLRYPYQKGQTSLTAAPVPITELPGDGYNQHWTRNVRVAPDGEHLFVTVGSESNVDQEAPPCAAVLRMKLDGTERSVFGSGLRNPVGLDFEPESGDVYVNVNERDELGDDLVPDYLTRVRQGGFYGWPYAYLTPENIDPRRTVGVDGASERPELVAETITPDVLYQSHSAALGLAFCDSDEWPERYRGGAFSALRGSWNRDRGTGYKIVFVPFENGRPTGVYEDFVTGFLLDPSVPKTCGRPVDVCFASDGALLFTEESNGRVYRIVPPSE